MKGAGMLVVSLWGVNFGFRSHLGCSVLGKMRQILRCDWLPEQARWSYLARSGLPVARPLGIESLIPSNNNAIFSSIFSLFWGKYSLKCSVHRVNIYLKERKENGIILV